MSDLFDITKFDSYKEDNRREVKKLKADCRIRYGRRILLLQIAMAGLSSLVYGKERMVHGILRD